MSPQLTDVIGKIRPDLIQGETSESALLSEITQEVKVLVGAETIRKIQVMHVFRLLKEEAKQGAFNFTDLNVPKGEFPDVSADKALKDLLKDPRVEDAS